MSECPTRHIITDFGDESFQTIDCTSTGNQSTTKRKYTKHKITNSNTNILTVVKHKNTQTPNPKYKTVQL